MLSREIKQVWCKIRTLYVSGHLINRSLRHYSRTTYNSKMDEIKYDHSSMSAAVKSILPELSHDKHKGQAGRIGVVGGCDMYTGAPYYAAISLLKVGADLSYVFCTRGAAPVIKAYSPELIVNPVLDDSRAVESVCEWLPRLHALVVGPGLGTDAANLTTVKGVMYHAKNMHIPVVVDADGLRVVENDVDVIKGSSLTTLTPNVNEFKRLYQSVMKRESCNEDPIAETIELSRALGDVTIVRKGRQDIICSGNTVVTCSVEGSVRRCGGQGDVLCGSMGTFMHWAHSAMRGNPSSTLKSLGPNIVAAYAACALTRECNRQAFMDHRRSTTTTDMIKYIQPSFEALFEQHSGSFV